MSDTSSTDTARPLNTEEAAVYLGTNPRHLEALRAKQKGPPFFKIGSLVRYRKDALDEWAREQEAKVIE